MKWINTLCVTTLVGALAFLAPSAHADMIESSEIVAIPSGVVGSGNGTLDLILFWEGGGAGVSENQDGAFDGDDANRDLPTGGSCTPTDSCTYAESYVTTAGKLKAFYDLNFGDGSAGSGATAGIDEIVLMLDLNETGGGAPVNYLALMDIILNPTTVDADAATDPDPVNTDVSSTEQEAIEQNHVGGSMAAFLDPAITNPPGALIPLNAQGAGFADYAIFTGINPYGLDDDDVLLFNQTLTTLNNGGETKFLSGEFSGGDIIDPPDPIPTPIPEPATMLLLGTGLIGVAGAARRRKKKQV